MSSIACRPVARLQTTRSARLQKPILRKTFQRRGVVTKVLCVLDVTEKSFEAEVLKSKEPVLVDFWASWCGPCKLVAPLMGWADKEYQGSLKVVKIEVDANRNLIEQYKVYGLPAFLLFKDGQAIEGSHWEGALTKKQLVPYLQKHGVIPAKVDA